MDLVVGNVGATSRIFYNLHLHHAVPDPADFGFRYRVELSLQPGYLTTTTLAVPLFSTGDARIVLPPLGVVGLAPATAFALPSIVIAPPGGTRALDLQLPPDPSLRGASLFSQVLFADPRRAHRGCN